MSNRNTTIATEPRDGLWLCASAICTGVAGGLLLVGSVGLFHAILDPLPQTTAMVVALVLLAAAIGPWIPQQIIAHQLRLIARDERRGPTEASLTLFPTSFSPQQRGLLWVLVAILSVTAGATAIIGTWMTGPLERLHQWFVDHSIISAIELSILDLFVIAGATTIPWLILGLLTTCLHHLAAAQEPPARQGGGLMASILIGAAVGALLAQTETMQTSPGRTILIGTIPLFFAAVIAVLRAGRKRPSDENSEPAFPLLPEWTSEGAYVLLGALVVWGIVLGTVLSVWPRALHIAMPLPRLDATAGGGLILAIAVGSLIGGRRARKAAEPAGACGPVLVLVGATTGLAIIGCALLFSDARAAGNSLTGWRTVLSVSLLAMSGIGLGTAFPYLRRAIVVQSGSPAIASAQVLSAAIFGTILGVVLTLCWVTPAAGTLVSLSITVLLALLTGGLLIIFEIGRPAGRRGRRLLAVFATLLFMMMGLPIAAQRWLRTHPNTVALLEGQWLTASVCNRDSGREVVLEPSRREAAAPRPRDMQQATHAVTRLHGPARHRLILTTGDIRVSERDKALCPLATVFAYDPVVSRLFQPNPMPDTEGLESSAPALWQLRTGHTRYDLIIIQAPSGGHEANAIIWTLETIGRAVAKLAPKGTVAALIRPADFERDEIAIITATFSQALPGFTRAALHGPDSDPVLILLGSTTQRPVWDVEAAAQEGLQRIGHVRTLLKLAHNVAPNSLRSPTLFLSDRRRGSGLELIHYVGQTSDWRPLEPSSRPRAVRPPLLTP